MKSSVILAALLSSLAAASAEPLIPDAWSQSRQGAFLVWLRAAGDASRPCSKASLSSPLTWVKVVASTCTVSRASGKPEQRERKLKVQIAGARWRGHPINSIEYEQQFSFEAGLVYHASMEFELSIDRGKPTEDVKAWWRQRGLTPIHDGDNIKDIVEREAGIEWVRPVGKVVRFATEFYE